MVDIKMDIQMDESLALPKVLFLQRSFNGYANPNDAKLMDMLSKKGYQIGHLEWQVGDANCGTLVEGSFQREIDIDELEEIVAGYDLVHVVENTLTKTKSVLQEDILSRISIPKVLTFKESQRDDSQSIYSDTILKQLLLISSQTFDHVIYDSFERIFAARLLDSLDDVTIVPPVWDYNKPEIDEERVDMLSRTLSTRGKTILYIAPPVGLDVEVLRALGHGVKENKNYKLVISGNLSDSTKKEISDFLTQRYGINPLQDFEFASEEPALYEIADVALIKTNDQRNAEFTLRAIRQGVPVLTDEKDPFCKEVLQSGKLGVGGAWIGNKQVTMAFYGTILEDDKNKQEVLDVQQDVYANLTLEDQLSRITRIYKKVLSPIDANPTSKKVEIIEFAQPHVVEDGGKSLFGAQLAMFMEGFTERYFAQNLPRLLGQGIEESEARRRLNQLLQDSINSHLTDVAITKKLVIPVQGEPYTTIGTTLGQESHLVMLMGPTAIGKSEVAKYLTGYGYANMGFGSVLEGLYPGIAPRDLSAQQVLFAYEQFGRMVGHVLKFQDTVAHEWFYSDNSVESFLHGANQITDVKGRAFLLHANRAEVLYRNEISRRLPTWVVHTNFEIATEYPREYNFPFTCLPTEDLSFEEISETILDDITSSEFDSLK